MKCNCGGVDRAMRVIAGLGLIALAFAGPQTPWDWIGVGPLLTGLGGFCPLHAILGLNTRAAERKKR